MLTTFTARTNGASLTNRDRGELTMASGERAFVVQKRVVTGSLWSRWPGSWI
jgi:hypothetical protein